MVEPERTRAAASTATGSRHRGRRRRLEDAGVAFGYLAVSAALFLPPLAGHLTTRYLGMHAANMGRTDPSIVMWSFQWWPHALRAGIDPLFTAAVWAPTGTSLAWATTMPGAALIAWPVTSWLGPVASYNLWMLASPALAAFTAYLLCRHLTRARWPSVVGGVLFGFSSYELAQMTAHLNLSLIFLVPLAVHLVVLRIERRLRAGWFVAALAGVLVLQFSFSTEVFLTLTMFGGLLLVAAFALGSAELRRELLRTAGWIVAAYAITAVVVAPYLLAAVSSPYPAQPLRAVLDHSTDGANLIVPTAVTALRCCAGVAGRFTASIAEEGAYLGGAVVFVALFLASAWRTFPGKLLGVAFAMTVLLTLGPRLMVAGANTHVPLPWAAVLHLLFLRDALPSRFVVYLWLGVGVAAAWWLARPRRGRWWPRWVVVALIVVSLFPNLPSSLWHANVDTPRFFAAGVYHRYLWRGENTIVIPYGPAGNSMLWQAQTGFFFRMAGGYVGCGVPGAFHRWSTVRTLHGGARTSAAAFHLRAFIAAKHVRAVIVSDGQFERWRWLLDKLAIRPVHAAGVWVYRISRQRFRQFHRVPPAFHPGQPQGRVCA